MSMQNASTPFSTRHEVYKANPAPMNGFNLRGTRTNLFRCDQRTFGDMFGVNQSTVARWEAHGAEYLPVSVRLLISTARPWNRQCDKCGESLPSGEYRQPTGGDGS